MNMTKKKTGIHDDDEPMVGQRRAEVARALAEVGEATALPLGLIVHALRARRRRSTRPRAA